MKIIQICPRYYPDIGGVETLVQEISERLVRRGHEVEVVCTDPRGIHPKKGLLNGVHISRFRSFAPNNAYYFAPQMLAYLRHSSVPVLHAHGYHAFPALFGEMAAQGKKFIFTPHYHGRGHTWFRNLLFRMYDPIGKKIFHRADKIICESEYEKQLIINKFNIQEKKIEYIPNGINFAEFTGIQADRDPFKLLYVGRIEEYKGIHHIIEALPRLPDFTLTVVGKGPYERELKRIASEFNVLPRITWKKDLSRNELIREYKSAGVFISLSSLEAYGLTVVEALASGVPVIVNNEGALAEFIDGGMCRGIEPSSGNLISAIEQIQGDHEYWKLISDWEEVVSRTIKVYESD